MDRRLQEENEKKKEYLKSYQRAVKRERDILEEIKRLRADKILNIPFSFHFLPAISCP